MRHHLKYILLFLSLLIFASDATAAHGLQGKDKDSVDVIVIDPGHGGDDTGAIGPRGTKEKEITLELARRLKEALTEKLGCTVLLTRTDDTFIPLEERTEFANFAGADIFISVHVNAAPGRMVKGIETFFLSYEATDDEARRLAAVENNVLGAEDGSLGEFSEGLNEILFDLTQNVAHHRSSALAESVHTRMVGSTGREDRGLKQAPFRVLMGAVMPAILLEVGFISNPDEERWLKSKKDLDDVAESIVFGILDFKDRKDYETVGFKRSTGEDRQEKVR